MMRIPMIKVNQPNAVRSLAADIILDNSIPTNIPVTANVVNGITNIQSKECNKLTLLITPTMELIAIINNDVPTANFISRLRKMTNDGIIRNPPPAPTRPVNNPMKSPSMIMNNIALLFVAVDCVFIGWKSKIINVAETNIRIANKDMMNPPLVIA